MQKRTITGLSVALVLVALAANSVEARRPPHAAGQQPLQVHRSRVFAPAHGCPLMACAGQGPAQRLGRYHESCNWWRGIRPGMRPGWVHRLNRDHRAGVRDGTDPRGWHRSDVRQNRDLRAFLHRDGLRPFAVPGSMREARNDTIRRDRGPLIDGMRAGARQYDAHRHRRGPV